MDDKGFHGAPDWIIEIMSPSSRQIGYLTKRFKYQEVGVREYWLANPTKEQVLVYKFEKETMDQYFLMKR